ncbi:MAG: nitroreductase/quinone reductase family protein [Kibdelosporangium sp.]
MDFNQQVITEFRANAGKVTYFEDARLLLLTTTGARTGRAHTTPLGYLHDPADRVLIIASAGGSPNHPAWYHNIKANPQVTVEDGIFTYQAEATILPGRERDEAFARAAEADPGWADYQAKTTRTIPVVALTQTAHDIPTLVQIHDSLRREMAIIRKEAATGTTLGAQLRVNCLTVCRGLTFHHTKEDQGLFPYLAAQHPDLAPTLERLDEEHQQIAVLVDALQQALAGDDADQVRAEVERLTEQLENHLAYEEEQLLPLLPQ